VPGPAVSARILGFEHSISSASGTRRCYVDCALPCLAVNSVQGHETWALQQQPARPGTQVLPGRSGRQADVRQDAMRLYVKGLKSMLEVGAALGKHCACAVVRGYACSEYFNAAHECPCVPVHRLYALSLRAYVCYINSVRIMTV